jgi:hypothetical protein
VGMDDKNTHTLWKDAGGGWSRTSQQASEPGDQNQVSVRLPVVLFPGNDFGDAWLISCFG